MPLHIDDFANAAKTRPAQRDLTGIVHRIHQNAALRQMMMRIDEPAPGIAGVGTCMEGDQARANIYLCGAAEVGATHQPELASWLRGLLSSERVAT